MLVQRCAKQYTARMPAPRCQKNNLYSPIQLFCAWPSNRLLTFISQNWPRCQIHCSDGWDRTAQARRYMGKLCTGCGWTKWRPVGATWQFVLGLTPRAEAPPSTPAENTSHMEFVGLTTWHNSRTGTEAFSVFVYRLSFIKTLCISRHSVQPRHFIEIS